MSADFGHVVVGATKEIQNNIQAIREVMPEAIKEPVGLALVNLLVALHVAVDAIFGAYHAEAVRVYGEIARDADRVLREARAAAEARPPCPSCGTGVPEVVLWDNVGPQEARIRCTRVGGPDGPGCYTTRWFPSEAGAWQEWERVTRAVASPRVPNLVPARAEEPAYVEIKSPPLRCAACGDPPQRLVDHMRGAKGLERFSCSPVCHTTKWFDLRSPGEALRAWNKHQRGVIASGRAGYATIAGAKVDEVSVRVEPDGAASVKLGADVDPGEFVEQRADGTVGPVDIPRVDPASPVLLDLPVCPTCKESPVGFCRESVVLRREWRYSFRCFENHLGNLDSGWCTTPTAAGESWRKIVAQEAWTLGQIRAGNLTQDAGNGLAAERPVESSPPSGPLVGPTSSDDGPGVTATVKIGTGPDPVRVALDELAAIAPAVVDDDEIPF